MKQLLLLRHAKAVPAKAGQGDISRILNGRGKSDAKAMGKAMADRGLRPDFVLCSPAARTRETWAIASEALGGTFKTEFRDTVYLASWSALLSLLQSVPDTVQYLMLVGHNPGLETLALSLARIGDETTERKRHIALSEKFPTAALAVLDFDIARWADIAPQTGALVALMTPKAL